MQVFNHFSNSSYPVLILASHLPPPPFSHFRETQATTCRAFGEPLYSQLGSGGVSLSVVADSATPWTVSHQAPLSLEFSRQEYWSGLPLSSPVQLVLLGFSHCPLKIELSCLWQFSYCLCTCFPSAKAWLPCFLFCSFCSCKFMSFFFFKDQIRIFCSIHYLAVNRAMYLNVPIENVPLNGKLLEGRSYTNSAPGSTVESLLSSEGFIF